MQHAASSTSPPDPARAVPQRPGHAPGEQRNRRAPGTWLVGAAAWLTATALLAGTCWQLFTQARAEYAHDYANQPESVALARQLDPRRAEYAKTQGDKWMDNAVPARPDLAAQEYRAAIELNPYDSIHWSAWGRASHRLGREAQARKAFEMAHHLDPNNQVVQMEIGNFLLARQEPAAAAVHYARAIASNPALARGLYPIFWQLGWSPLQVAQALLGPNYERPEPFRTYLYDCLSWASPAQAQELWQAFRAQPGLMDELATQAYFKFLLAKGEITTATALWRQIAREVYGKDWDPAAEPLWNGNLALAPRFPGGLEWTIDKVLPAGVQAVISPSKTSNSHHAIWLHFTGQANVAFSQVRHAFFVQPGQAYTLSFAAKALDLTTDNGVYVQVLLHGPGGETRVNSPVMSGHGHWEPVMKFTAPADTQWGEIIVRRDFSHKLDNKIRGNLWLDSFSLRPRPQGAPSQLP